MWRELERGDIDAFANLMSKHWSFSKQLDKGTTNTCTDQIFNVIDNLIEGKMICGAGGGGFLQVVLKKGVKVSEINERLYSFFGSAVSAWTSRFV